MTAHPRPVTNRRTLLKRATLGVLITGAFLFVLSRFVDWPQLVALFRNSQPRWLLGAVGFYVAIYFVRGLRFYLLARGTTLVTMLCITCVHNFLLRLLPMRTGDLSYAILLKRAGIAGLGEGVLSLILLRLLDAGAVVVLFGITLAVNRGVYLGDPTPGFIAAAVVFALGVIGVVSFNRLLRLGQRALSAVARLLHLDRRPKVHRALERLGEEIQAFARIPLPVLLQITAATAVQWLLNFAIIFAIMRAFSVEVSIAQAVLGGTAAVVSAFLPIGGIGSFGALEAGWSLGFALVGLDPSVAVASAFGFSIVTFIYAGSFGLIGWLGLGLVGRRRRHD